MRLILLVGLGGFIGGVSRYLISLFIVNRGLIAFPYGTFTVNILGCFLIGIVYGIAERTGMTDEWRLFLATGVLGGFTTFSAFSYESISLFRDGQSGAAILYVTCSVLLGLLATWAGITAAS